MNGHHKDCPWQVDQYPHECTCGAATKDLIPESKMIATVRSGPCEHQWGYMTATGGIACGKCHESRPYTDPEAKRVREQFAAATRIKS